MIINTFILFSIFFFPTLAYSKRGGLRHMEECKYGPILRNDDTVSNGSPIQDDKGNAFIEQMTDGSIQVRLGTPDDPGNILWKSLDTDFYSRYGPNFTTVFQGDGHLITRSTSPGHEGRFVYRSLTSYKPGNYFFGLNCNATLIMIAETRDDNDRELRIIWARDVLPKEGEGEPYKVVLTPNQVAQTGYSTYDVLGRHVMSNDLCSFIFQGDGVITIKRRDNPSQSWEENWASSVSIPNPPQAYFSNMMIFSYRLNKDNGSIEAFYTDDDEKERIYYTSNNPIDAFPGVPKNFKLILWLDTCTMEVIQDTSDNVVWSHNRNRGISNRDPNHRIIQRGEMFHTDTCDPSDPCPESLFLQKDCNLVRFVGSDLFSYTEVVSWATDTSYNGDCYLFAGSDGLFLYTGTYNREQEDVHPGQILWSDTSDQFGGYTVRLARNAGVEGTCGVGA